MPKQSLSFRPLAGDIDIIMARVKKYDWTRMNCADHDRFIIAGYRRISKMHGKRLTVVVHRITMKDGDTFTAFKERYCFCDWSEAEYMRRVGWFAVDP